MKISKIVKNYRLYALLLVADLLFFGFFSPTGSSVMIIPAFLLVTANFWLLLRATMQFLARFIDIKPVVRKRIVTVVMVSLTIIVALQSIGQLTTKDVVTVVPLVAVLYFYLAYARSHTADH